MHRLIAFRPVLLVLLAGLHFAAAGADDVEPGDEPQTRIYRNPEERREAGLGRQVTDWLTLSGLLEIEQERIERHFDNNIEFTEDEGAIPTVQVGLDFTFSETLTAEFVLESEHDKRTHSKVDEGLISMDLEPWGLEAGRLYVPFGEYYSHFVTDPLLEFGETRADAFVADYTFAGAVELAAYVFDGDIHQRNGKDPLDWGVNVDYANESESLRAGAGYLSDLAESDERLLADSGNSVRRRTPAANMYVLLGFYPVEITAEYVKAMKKFVELDEEVNRPSAYNLELAYFPAESMQMAFRFEGSDEFSDAPERRWGVNWTWRMTDRALFSMDYMRSEYRSGFVSDDDDNALKDSNSIAAQLAVEF